MSVPNATPDCLMTPREHGLLREIARGKLVLEMGAWHGETTRVLAEVAATVWTVDHFGGDGFTGYDDVLPAYLATLAASGRQDKVVTVVGEFSQVLPVLGNSTFDLVVVDGAHDYESVRRDVTYASVLVKPDGAIVVHDYGRWEVEPASVQQLGEPNEVYESLAVWRLPL